jgi:hypothetical protein
MVLRIRIEQQVPHPPGKGGGIRNDTSFLVGVIFDTEEKQRWERTAFALAGSGVSLTGTPLCETMRKREREVAA